MNMNVKKLLTVGLASTLLMSTPIALMSTAVAATDSSNNTDNMEAAKRLNDLLVNTKSMTANFTQVTKGSKAMNGQFAGTMAVQRPSKFRWETTKPSKQLIIADSSKLWVYDTDLEQATVQSVSNQVGNTPALLLSGDPKQISDSFKITQPHYPKNYYVLYPKSDNANFKNMTISFNAGKPVMMVLNDNLGQTTTIKFSNIKLNPSISGSKFTFTPPKGVDVIRQ